MEDVKEPFYGGNIWTNLKGVSILVLMEDVKEQSNMQYFFCLYKRVSILVLMEDVKEHNYTGSTVNDVS